jgi:two-component system CheB/CheR fusion protein
VARCVSTYESAFDVRAPFTMEYRLRDAHGSYHVVRDMGLARFEDNGAFCGYVSACMDVTDLVAPQPQ